MDMTTQKGQAANGAGVPIQSLPAPVLVQEKQPIALRAIMDDALTARLENAAKRMAKAAGITPPHLLNQPETCFDIICLAMDSGLSPGFLAKSTFPIEGNKKVTDQNGRDQWVKTLSIGYESKLVRALMMQSGFFSHIEEEEVGDWGKVQNRWKWAQGSNNKKYQQKAYTDDDEQGLAIRIRVIQAKDNREVTWEMEMGSMWPRNSTLWATDPKTQAKYYALRRFCNLRYPAILGGAFFDDDNAPVGPEFARDITPSGTEIEGSSVASAVKSVEVVDAFGTLHMVVEDQITDVITRWILEAAGLDELQSLEENAADMFAQYDSLKDSLANARTAFEEASRAESQASSGVGETPDDTIAQPQTVNLQIPGQRDSDNVRIDMATQALIDAFHDQPGRRASWLHQAAKINPWFNGTPAHKQLQAELEA